MDIKKIAVYLFIILIVGGHLYSIVTGFMNDNYKEVISSFYGLSIFGLLAMLWIKTSDSYLKFGKHHTLLIGLSIAMLIFTILLFICMFIVGYNWFIRILQFIMILLIASILRKALQNNKFKR